MQGKMIFEKLLGLFSDFQSLELTLTSEIDIGPLTHLQFKALQMIYLHPQSTTSSISTCLGLSLPNASREIQKLVAGAYVQKSQDQTDKRIFWLELTPVGLDFVRRTLGEIKLKLDRLVEKWPQKKLADFSAALDVVSANLPK